MEGTRQIVALSRNGHMAFLHRLQQRRLRARAGAVDFVGHQKLAEHRPLDEAEGAAAVIGLFQHFRAHDVARHQVGRELDALGVHAEHDPERVDEAGLGQARYADQQTIAAGEQRDQDLIDNGLLAENKFGNRFACGGETGAHFIGHCLRIGGIEPRGKAFVLRHFGAA